MNRSKNTRYSHLIEQGSHPLPRCCVILMLNGEPEKKTVFFKERLVIFIYENTLFLLFCHLYDLFPSFLAIYMTKT